MSSFKKSSNNRARKKSFTTRSGKAIKVNQSLIDRLKVYKAGRSRRRANRLATLPKSPIKRMLFRLHPKRLFHYWFSKDGLIMALKITGVGIVVVFVLLIGLFAYFRKDLPQLNNISGGNLSGTNSYYDNSGKVLLWQDYDAIKRVPVQSNQISSYMKEATVAIEDKNFYHEGAFSVTGIIRAGFHDLIGGGSGLQGASTITEQTVKLNEDWTQNRTVITKIKELILAVDLEREYSKDQILTGYLNTAPYGGVDYGVEVAARDYFHEDASQLTLAQSAMLAAIPQAPSYYSPYSDPKYNSEASTNEFGIQALIDRQQYILDQMAKQHYITQAQANAAQSVDILAEVHTLQNKYSGIKAPYFVLAAKQELINKYGMATVNRGGWKIITTLDMKLQNEAESLISQNLPLVQSAGGDEEAVVGEDVQTGQIVSLVGGTNFSASNENNYAAGIQIPPGSSFKPYDFSTLINDNTDVGAGSVLYDSEGPIPGYACTTGTGQNGNCLHDFDYNYPGPMTIRYALGGSRNVTGVKAMLLADPGAASPGGTITSGDYESINKVISTATAMMDNPYVHGSTYNCYPNDPTLTTAAQCGPASAIGDGAYLYLDDHVNGLSTLARMGVAIPRTFILRIEDSNGKTIEQWTQPKGTQVIKPDTAYILNNMLSDPAASYFGGYCSATNCYGYKFQRYNGWDIAAKTGTTANAFDGLMTAWSTKYAVVTWVGSHNRNVPLTLESDIETEPLARGWIEYALNGLKPVNWQQPSDIKTLPSYPSRLAYSSQGPVVTKDIFPSWYQPKSNVTASAVIDKVSGKLATSCTPPLAKETVGGANVNAFSIDIFYPPGASYSNSSSVPKTTDNVHNCDDTLPSITLTQNDCADATHCTFTATATQGTHPLSGGSYKTAPAGTISLLINGKVAATMSIPSGSNPATVSFTNASAQNGQTASAQVVDSVLYSNNSSSFTVQNNKNINPGNNGPKNLSSTPSGPSGIYRTFTWTGGTAPFIVYETSPGGVSPVSGCNPAPTNSCTSNIPIGGGTFYVQDADGKQSPNYHF